MARNVRAGQVACLAVGMALVAGALSGPALAQEGSAEPAASVASEASSPPAAVAWSGTELPGAAGITVFGDRFVAVGSDGASPGRAQAWTSMDGVTWEPATVTDAAEGTAMSAVTSLGTGLVAVGTATSEGAAGPDQVAAWSSVDGLTWQPASVRRASRDGLGASVSDLATGPAGSLALAGFIGQDLGDQRLYRTTDGLTWAPQRISGTGDIIWSALASTPDGYLLIGSTSRGRPRTMRSADGETWERVSTAPRGLLDAASAPTGPTIGITDRRILATADLDTWDGVDVVADADADLDTPAIDLVLWDGARFATSGVIYEGCPEGVDECYQRWLQTSSDGITWTESTGPDGAAGPDEATQILDLATLGDTTVVLGGAGPSPTMAWVMQE
jgi:hypothetical protein